MISIQEALDWSNAVGNEFASGDPKWEPDGTDALGPGADRLCEEVGADPQELKEMVEGSVQSEFPRIPAEVYKILCAELIAGFVIGARWAQERDRG